MLSKRSLSISSTLLAVTMFAGLSNFAMAQSSGAETYTPTPLPAGSTRTDSQGVSQVWVPAGCFNMGSDPAKDLPVAVDASSGHHRARYYLHTVFQRATAAARVRELVRSGSLCQLAHQNREGWNGVPAADGSGVGICGTRSPSADLPLGQSVLPGQSQ